MVGLGYKRRRLGGVGGRVQRPVAGSEMGREDNGCCALVFICASLEL